MQSFLSFLQHMQARSQDLPARNICFVARESQIRVYDFLSHVLSKQLSKKFLVSSVPEELELSSYDQTSQLGLFATGEMGTAVGSAFWLKDFLVPSDSAGFLTQAQKSAELSRLALVFEKNPNKTYFFEISVKDFEGSKAFFDAVSGCAFVKLPEALSPEEFALCADLMGFSSSISLQDLYTTRLEMPLDHALILFDHASCVSKRTWETFKEYSFGLLSSNSQLRDLSESFWTRNSKRFFAEWKRIGEEYPESFWVAYWSTQLFLAYFYIERAQHVAKITPGGAEHGLSPTFTWKNGWKKYSKEYCEQLHSKLYEIDLELKNGSDGAVFEYFFNRHFLADKVASRL